MAYATTRYAPCPKPPFPSERISSGCHARSTTTILPLSKHTSSTYHNHFLHLPPSLTTFIFTFHFLSLLRCDMIQGAIITLRQGAGCALLWLLHGSCASDAGAATAEFLSLRIQPGSYQPAYGIRGLQIPPPAPWRSQRRAWKAFSGHRRESLCIPARPPPAVSPLARVAQGVPEEPRMPAFILGLHRFPAHEIGWSPRPGVRHPPARKPCGRPRPKEALNRGVAAGEAPLDDQVLPGALSRQPRRSFASISAEDGAQELFGPGLPGVGLSRLRRVAPYQPAAGYWPVLPPRHWLPAIRFAPATAWTCGKAGPAPAEVHPFALWAPGQSSGPGGNLCAPWPRRRQCSPTPFTSSSTESMCGVYA